MRLLSLFALLLAIASPLTLAAGDSRDCRVGEITRVHGDVKVVRSGRTLVPLNGEALCVHDRFITSERGIAQLAFPDGTEITVGRDSVFVVSQWKQRSFFANVARFELVSGSFRALTGAITQRRNSFEVKTAIANIGIRGTEFWGSVNISPGSLDVLMLNGAGIYVKNANGTSEITEAGKGVSVRSGKAPTTPVVWSPEKVQRALGTITP